MAWAGHVVGEGFACQGNILTGEDAADIKSKMISFTSPIARGLIGKSEGYVVWFQAPGGEKTFEILEVRYV